MSASGSAVRRCGESALLLDAADPAALAAALHGQAGIEELVPAAATVLVHFDPAVIGADELIERLATVAAARGERKEAPVMELPTVYDGADLDEVAALTGLTAAEVIDRHARRLYTVAFCGFSPGFAYLDGGDPTLTVPRRETPREVVPAGSVAIADRYTGVYPRRLPGGWRLLGRTDAPLWRLDRDPPSLLAPGTRVRFVRT